MCLRRGTTIRLLGLLSLWLTFSPALKAQDDLAKAWKKVADDAWKYAWEKVDEEAYAEVKDDPNLPRVLLIGDSISSVYVGPVRHIMKGRANVHHPPTNCSSTVVGLGHLAEWLGQGKWDVIHFNWGLHDLIVQGDDSHRVPLGQYGKNLQELVRRLKATGARLIWASTTPIPERIEPGKPLRRNADVIAYNAEARKIMEEHQIPINDLYAFALPRLKEIQVPFDVHFTFEGSELFAKQIAASILVELGPG
jgi:GDSL-like lipase/acylhydrolase family protein